MSIEQDGHIQDCLQNKYAEFLGNYDAIDLFKHYVFLIEKEPVSDLYAWVINQIMAIDPTGKKDDCFQDSYTYED